MQTEDKMQTGGELGIFYKFPPSHSHVIVLVAAAGSHLFLRCVFLAPVRFRLAELCIAERQLDFICMYECLYG